MEIFNDPNLIRLSAFLGLLLLFAAAEAVFPRRKRRYGRLQRWLTNVSISGVNTVLLRLMAAPVLALTAVAAALYSARNEIGLMHHLDLGFWPEVILSLLLLDLAIYAQHVASHKIPILWRLHRVHHSDVDIDVTTAIRFHPIEIGLSMLYKMLVIIALGPQPLAVLMFEIILNGCAMFNHSNLALPRWLDRIVRLVLVTPDMHRVHHSTIRSEHDSNYGFNIPLWDRLFRTYTPQPSLGHHDMNIGLDGLQDKRPTGLVWSLRFPFRKAPQDGAAPSLEKAEMKNS